MRCRREEGIVEAGYNEVRQIAYWGEREQFVATKSRPGRAISIDVLSKEGLVSSVLLKLC